MSNAIRKMQDVSGKRARKRPVVHFDPIRKARNFLRQGRKIGAGGRFSVVAAGGVRDERSGASGNQTQMGYG